MPRKRSMLFWIWLMMAVAYLDRVNITVAGPTLSGALHLSPTVFGYVLSAFTLGYALMQVPGGYLADRFGARSILITALVLWSVFTAATGLAWSAASLIAIRVLFGLGEGIENGAQFKLIGDNFDSRERSEANATFLTALAVGPAVAAPLTTWLIGAGGWRTAFYVYAVIGIIVAALLYRFLPSHPSNLPSEERAVNGIGASGEGISPSRFQGEGRGEVSSPSRIGRGGEEGAGVGSSSGQERAGAGSPADAEKPSMATALRQPAIWLLFAAYLLFNIAFWGFIGWMPTYLSAERHIDLKHLGLIASIPYVCGFFGMLLLGRIGTGSAYRQRPVLIASAYLLAGVFLYATYTQAHVAQCIAGLSAAAFFLYGGFGPFWATAIDRMPGASRGSLSGFINFGGQIGGFIAPIVVGRLVSQAHTFTPGFLFMIGALALAALSLFALAYAGNHSAAQSA